MELTIVRHQVTDIQFGGETRLEGDCLVINADDLCAHLLEDDRLVGADLEIVHPGEDTRAGSVFDIIEPRAKAPGGSPDFPGILGEVATAGQGTTHILEGAAVTVLNEMSAAERGGRQDRILEMSGPASEHSHYATLHHLILVSRTREELAPHVRMNAGRLASVKAAVYLARAGMGEEPASSETYGLVGPAVAGHEGLPRVAYVGQIYSRQRSPEVDEQIVYGVNTNGMMPLLLHPNEWLDGAIVPAYVLSLGGQETYFYQNHPVIIDLYRRHWARELNFVGTVATIAATDNDDRDRNCHASANFVKWGLGADAAVLTKFGGGVPHMDMAVTANILESKGVNTAVMVSDMSGDRRVESALLFNFPDVDAVVYCGGDDTKWTLPEAGRAIAGDAVTARTLAAVREVGAASVVGVTNQQGATHIQSVIY
jgi:hypothetical protein